MTPKTHRRLAATALLTAALPFAFVGPATAAAPQPVAPAVTDYDAGIACAFPLRLSSTAGKVREKEFTDRSGNVVRMTRVTTGIAYTNTNLSTGKSLTIDARGSVISTTVKDGIATVTATGQTGMILYPSDVPAGPSNVVYRGRLVFTIDLATDVFTIVSSTGTKLDVCAALS